MEGFLSTTTPSSKVVERCRRLNNLARSVSLSPAAQDTYSRGIEGDENNLHADEPRTRAKRTLYAYFPRISTGSDGLSIRPEAQENRGQDFDTRVLNGEDVDQSIIEGFQRPRIEASGGLGSGYVGVVACGNSRQHNGNITNNTGGGHAPSGEGIVIVGNNITNTFTYKQRKPRTGSGSCQETLNEDLLIAACEGQTQRVGLLRDQGADIDYQDGQGLTALHCASFNGYEDVIQLLIDFGADRNAQSVHLGTPLCVACLRSKLPAVKTLLNNRADVQIAGESVGTPLHCASYVGSIELVDFLKQHGADTNACSSVRLELLEHGRMLNSAFAGILQRPSKGNLHRIIDCTPIYLAVARRNEDLLKYFLRNDCSAKDSYRVWDTENPDHGDATFEDTMQSSKCSECTLLMAASGQGDLRIVSYLIESGASLDATDTKGRSALYYAAMDGHIACVQKLADFSAPVDVQDNGLTTPFFIAAYQGHVQIMKLLAKRGANINHQIRNGDTALHLAARHGRLKVTQTLLSLHADLTQRNQFGLTPMDLANDKGHAEIADCLDNYDADMLEEDAMSLASGARVVESTRVERSKAFGRVETGRIKRQANHRLAAKHAVDVMTRLVRDRIEFICIE